MLYFSFPFSPFCFSHKFYFFLLKSFYFYFPLISNNSLHIFPKIYYFIHFSSFLLIFLFSLISLHVFFISLIYPLFFLIFDLVFNQLIQKFSVFPHYLTLILITYPSPTVDFFLFGVDFMRLSAERVNSPLKKSKPFPKRRGVKGEAAASPWKSRRLFQSRGG